ncbi:MAG: AIR synthase-related protein [Halobacteriales archaeon]
MLNCVGLADRYVPTGGAEPGDDVILTKRAAIEGTAILATDFRDLVTPAVDDAVLERGAKFYDDVSVIDDAAAVREFAHAMHDPTEGGLVDGLLEMAVASGVAMDVDPDAIPVAEETRQLAAAADVDPLRIFGSGALVASVPGEATDDALAALEAAGVRGTVIGTVRESDEPRLEFGETTYREAVRDDMYALWE